MASSYRDIVNAHDQLVREFKTKSGYGNVSSVSVRGVPGGTQALRSIQNYNLKVVRAGTAFAFEYALFVGLSKALDSGARQALAGASDGLEAFLENAHRRASRKVGLTRRHQQLASQAREAVIQDFVTNRQSSVESYRPGQQRLPGRLKKALESDAVFRAQRDGIAINEAVLSRIAAHYRRMNYGFGGLGTDPKAFRLRLSGALAPGGAIRMPGRPNNEPSFMPGGLFLNNNGKVVPYDSGHKRSQDKFYLFKYAQGVANYKNKGKPISGNDLYRFAKFSPRASGGLNYGKKLRTKGFKGYHFMDAGMKVIADRQLDIWAEEGRKWIAEGSVLAPVATKPARM